MSKDGQHPVFDRCDLVIDCQPEADLATELFGSTLENVVDLSEDTTVRYEGTYKTRDFAATEAVMLSLEVVRDVGLGVFSAWIYEKLKGEQVTISTPRGSINVTDDMEAEELAQVLEVLLKIEDER